MADVMTVATWLKLTDGGTFARRGTELKRVDDALAAYHKAPSPGLQDSTLKALIGYMKAEGPAYKTGSRNKFKAIDDLYAQLTGQATLKKNGADLVALSHLRDESRAIINDLFLGKQLKYKLGLVEIMKQKYRAFGVVNTGRTLYKATGGSGAKISNPFGSDISFIQALVPAEHVPDVLHFVREAMPDFLQHLGASLVPFAGVAVSGVSTLVQAVVTVKSQYTLLSRNNLAMESLVTGEPQVALAAVLRLLQRARDFNVAQLAIGAAGFTAKLAGVLADGGTVSNAATGFALAVTRFTEMIFEILTDVIEARAGNARMARRDGVDANVFKDCPLVGAYLVCCAPTSVLVNGVFDRFGQHGWRGEVEHSARKQLTTIRETAGALIRGHRYRIAELMHYPGVLEVNKKKIKEMKAKKGLTGMEGFGSDD
jgi:hypothetical protein